MANKGQLLCISSHCLAASMLNNGTITIAYLSAIQMCMLLGHVHVYFFYQGAVVLRQSAVLDREDPFVLINSLGQGVMSFDIRVTNTAPSATLTATATVSQDYSITVKKRSFLATYICKNTIHYYMYIQIM